MGATALLAGYAADIALGDPDRFHPVAGFGRLAARLERHIYAPTRLRGALATAALVGAAAGGAELAARRAGRFPVLAALTWTALGGRSLRREARTVEAMVAADDLEAARVQLRALCGRDATRLDATQIRAAVIESLAENSSDAVVAALFWAALLGPAGASGYRAANTLDAIWGHHNARYEDFGWAPARLDDLLNWLPARLTSALAMMAAPLVGGACADAFTAVTRDAATHPSPNAGVAEAAFAGALRVRLGGPLAYGGRAEIRPYLCPLGGWAGLGDVHRAERLSRAVCTGAVLLLSGGMCAGSVISARWRDRRDGRDSRRSCDGRRSRGSRS